MKINIKYKILTPIFAFISILLIVLFLINWSYSIFDISADNYEKKLHTNNGSLYSVDIDEYIPRIDKECFSINMRGISALGQRYGVEILKTYDLYKDQGANWTSDYGTYYSFEPAPSDLEYKILYEKDKDSYITDNIIDISIGSKFKAENSPKIKEIIKELIEKNGFTLKRTQLIYGHDIIIKETEDSFIVGFINGKYDYHNQPTVGLYLKSYSKKHLF